MESFAHVDLIDVELENGASIYRNFTNRTIGEGDASENTYGVRVFRNGEQVSLVGCTVIGHFIRADGTTVTINGGAVSGNTAKITLPESCYAVEGNFTLAIKVSGGSVTGTMRIIDGTVVNTTSGTVIDPGSAVPDLATLLAVIEDAEEAAETIYGISITAELIDGEDYNIIVTKE